MKAHLLALAHSISAKKSSTVLEINSKVPNVHMNLQFAAAANDNEDFATW